MFKKIAILALLILSLFIIALVNYVAFTKEKRADKKIPVVLYHDVSVDIPSSDPYNYEYITTIENLEENIQTLLNNGYQIITINDLKNVETLPEKPIIITFDDGLVSNYDLVFPILKKYNIKVGMSITTDLVGTYDDVENRRYFTWEQAKEMAESGLVEFYSHGKRHIFYAKISLTEFEEEVLSSVTLINQKLNINNSVFVYPYGSYNSCMVYTLQNKVEFQLYDAGVNTVEELDYSFIKRINVSYYMSGKDIIKIIED